jgi:hypothetical protein
MPEMELENKNDLYVLYRSLKGKVAVRKTFTTEITEKRREKSPWSLCALW